jgi:uncharacterized protein YutE (UPF0331/DUF86 family)
MDTFDKIRFKLTKIRSYVKVVERYKGVIASELEKNINISAVAERYLQLAIDACVDVAEMVIIDQRLKSPEDAGDAIRVLGSEKVIDEDFAKNFAGAVGFRNILVHEYVDINYEEEAKMINERLEDFERFAGEVAKFYELKIPE